MSDAIGTPSKHGRLSGRFAREWTQCRLRIRIFWFVLFAYPLLAAVAVWFLQRQTQGPIALPFIIAWPILLFIAASWWRSWPCPQCSRPFFFIDRTKVGTIFGIKACHWCGLPKWGMEGGVPLAPLPPAVPLAGGGVRQESCWYCSSGNGDAAPLMLKAITEEERRELKIPRCRRCALAHQLERGMGSIALGLIGFAVVGVLFIRGINPAMGFGAALLRMIPFAGLAFALSVAGFLIGVPIGKPALWGTRPMSDWEQHSDIQRKRAEGWEIFRTETSITESL